MNSERPTEQSSESTGAKQPVAPNYAPADGKIDGKFQVVDEQQLERVVQQVLRAEAFSGPTPHPEHLERYERTFNGAAKIIFDEYQANSQHQRDIEKGMLDLENRKLDAASKRDTKSLNRAFLLVFFGFGVVALCALLKQPWLGGAVAGTLLVAVLRAYLPRGWIGKSPDAQDATNKSDEPDAVPGKD